MISLKPYNTFGVEAFAEQMLEFATVEDIVDYCKLAASSRRKFFVLGGGSNLLFVGDFNGDILRITNRDIEVVKIEDDYVDVWVGAGFIWDEFVAWTTEHELWGAELLSGIPGTVGAAPVQNIGAYGAEAADIVVRADTVCLGRWHEGVFLQKLSNSKLSFSYRNSYIKEASYERHIVYGVIFRLSRHIPKDRSNFVRLGLTDADITPELVRNKVLEVRASKLPPLSELGSAGSFFKNPMIDYLNLHRWQTYIEDIPFYPQEADLVKVPAGWIIEHCGWKGYREGQVGVYPKHSLILVNYGGATGLEILDLSLRIAEDVRKKLGVRLKPEVEVV